MTARRHIPRELALNASMTAQIERLERQLEEARLAAEGRPR